VPFALVALVLVPAIAGSLRLVELAGGPLVLPANPRVSASPVPVIMFGSMTAHGYPGILAACAALTVLALIVIGVVRQATKPASQPA
jgi:hypothetical protein